MILRRNPENASAWNGLGSVALLRKEPQKALQYIEVALTLNPDYEAAKHDREIARKMLGELEQRDKA